MPDWRELRYKFEDLPRDSKIKLIAAASMGFLSAIILSWYLLSSGPAASSELTPLPKDALKPTWGIQGDPE